MCFEHTTLRGNIKQMAEHRYSLHLSWHFLHEHGCETWSPAQRSSTWNHQHWSHIGCGHNYGYTLWKRCRGCSAVVSSSFSSKELTGKAYKLLFINENREQKTNSLAVKNMQICWSPNLKADGSAVTASRVFDQTSVLTGERNNREVLWSYVLAKKTVRLYITLFNSALSNCKTPENVSTEMYFNKMCQSEPENSFCPLQQLHF